MLYYPTFFIALMFFITVSHGKPALSRLNAPKPCCLSNQYTALLTISTAGKGPNAEPTATYNVFNYTYDGNRRMIAMKGMFYSIIDEKDSNLWIIQDIAGKQSYTIDLKSKKCTKASTTDEPFLCVPNSATYMYSSMYGYGNRQYLGDSWFIEDNDEVGVLTVSGDGNCVPMSSNTYDRNLHVSSSIIIANYVTKVNDPSVFTIPEECKMLA